MQGFTYAKLHNNNAGEEICETANGKMYSPPRHICCEREILPHTYIYTVHTRFLTPTESTPPGSTAWSVLRAVIRRKAFLFFFILVDTVMHYDDDSSWTSCVKDYTVLVMWWARKYSFFHLSLLLSVDKSFYLVLLSFIFDYYKPVSQ